MPQVANRFRSNRSWTSREQVEFAEILGIDGSSSRFRLRLKYQRSLFTWPQFRFQNTLTSATDPNWGSRPCTVKSSPNHSGECSRSKYEPVHQITFENWYWSGQCSRDWPTACETLSPRSATRSMIFSVCRQPSAMYFSVAYFQFPCPFKRSAARRKISAIGQQTLDKNQIRFRHT